jgi:hypothetical protein
MEGGSMGTLTYDETVVEFDDRTLTHLEIVIVQRFRTGSGLLLSWTDPLSVGGGRSSLWLTPKALVRFWFAGSRVPEVDRVWVSELAGAAGSGAGLVVCDEHGDRVQPATVRNALG